MSLRSQTADEMPATRGPYPHSHDYGSYDTPESSVTDYRRPNSNSKSYYWNNWKRRFEVSYRFKYDKYEWGAWNSGNRKDLVFIGDQWYDRQSRDKNLVMRRWFPVYGPVHRRNVNEVIQIACDHYRALYHHGLNERLVNGTGSDGENQRPFNEIEYPEGYEMYRKFEIRSDAVGSGRGSTLIIYKTEWYLVDLFEVMDEIRWYYETVYQEWCPETDWRLKR